MELLTLRQAAEMLKVSVSTVRNMIRRREVPHLRVRRQIRFVRDELEEWVKGRVTLAASGSRAGQDGGASANAPAAEAPFRSVRRA